MTDRNIQVYTRANGGAAIDTVIEAAEAAGVTAADDRRNVVIHSNFMRPDQLDDYVRLGLIPSFFTVHSFFWGDVHRENLGEERAFFLSPMKPAQERGIRFTNHNDFMVTPVDPMFMIWTAVQRISRNGVAIGPDQRVDVWTALKALTIDVGDYGPKETCPDYGKRQAKRQHNIIKFGKTKAGRQGAKSRLSGATNLACAA